MSNHLTEPHGGELAQLMVDDARREEIQEASRDWPSWDLKPSQVNDVELLITGAFSPLTGFMGQEEAESVTSTVRLRSGAVWPVPITLDVSEDFAKDLKAGVSVALRDAEGVMLAVVKVEEVWSRDGFVSLAGPVEGVELPSHYDFRSLRLTPEELRAEFGRLGWRKVLACQSPKPMHRAEQERTLRVVREEEVNLLLQPRVGSTQLDDVEHYTRIRCFQALLAHYPRNTAKLALIPLSSSDAAAKEALLHAIVHKNYGCSHFLLGAHHEEGALDLLNEHADELGIKAVNPEPMVYVEDQDAYMPADDVPEGARSQSISEEDLEERLEKGRDIPAWFTLPEVAEELRKAHPPRHRQGFTVFFTGLSGSGKSTIANALVVKLHEMGGRPITLLDGDIVRKNLSSELGFSKEHRNLNILRIGYVASEITKNGGIAVCAPIAPYEEVRRQNRALIDPLGGYILIHVATPIEVCEQRDRKGLYAKARAGIIKEFTGISDPYEVPENADMSIDTTDISPEEAAQEIILHLEREGYIGGDA